MVQRPAPALPIPVPPSVVVRDSAGLLASLVNGAAVVSITAEGQHRACALVDLGIAYPDARRSSEHAGLPRLQGLSDLAPRDLVPVPAAAFGPGFDFDDRCVVQPPFVFRRGVQRVVVEDCNALPAQLGDGL